MPDVDLEEVSTFPRYRLQALPLPQSPYMTMREAAAYLRLSPVTLYRLFETSPPAWAHRVRVGARRGTWRVHRPTLEAALRGQG